MIWGTEGAPSGVVPEVRPQEPVLLHRPHDPLHLPMVGRHDATSDLQLWPFSPRQTAGAADYRQEWKL